MAERYGSDLGRRLRSAERLSEAVIGFGLRCLNTPPSRSSASLSSVTRCDHFLVPRSFAERRLRGDLALRDDVRSDALRAIAHLRSRAVLAANAAAVMMFLAGELLAWPVASPALQSA